MSAKTPCQTHDNPDLWVSEYADERAEAAQACRGCHRIAACLQDALAGNVSWGVWAGRDLSRTKPNAKNPAAAQCQNRECGKPVDRHGTRRQYCDAVCRSREAYLGRRGAA